MRESHRRPGFDERIRRQHLQKMRPLEEKFLGLVDHWVYPEELREHWREHFYDAAPAPESPSYGPSPLFVGASADGTRVEIRPLGDDKLEIVVDGDVAGRVQQDTSKYGLVPEAAVRRFVPQAVREIFEAPEEACAWLDRWHAGGGDEPAWEYGPKLYADGLIDENFSVTDRGRRMLANRRGEQRPEAIF